MHDKSLLQQVTVLQLGLPSELGNLIFYTVVTGYCVIKTPIKSIIIYKDNEKQLFI